MLTNYRMTMNGALEAEENGERMDHNVLASTMKAHDANVADFYADMGRKNDYSPVAVMAWLGY